MPIAPPSSAPAGSPAEDLPSPERPQRETVTVGELEAGYSLYCKAMRRLIQEGRSLKQIQRTVCWERLALLHTSLPGQYKDPEYLYLLLRRQNSASAT